MNKHILVVSQYFFPENFRINDICNEWIIRGYKVTVLTGIPNYPSGKFFKGYGLFKKRRELLNGINIIRIPIFPRGNNFFTLSLNYLSFVISGWIWKTFTKVKADLVFIYEVSPMTQAFPGLWFAKRRKIESYLYVTDLWPESVQFAVGLKNKYLIDLVQKMVDRIYQNSSFILTSSKGFFKPIIDRGISLEKIMYWPQYAESIYRPFKNDFKDGFEIPQDKIFNITFTGNIGYAQGLSVLVETALILKSKNVLVRFNLIGEGRYKKDLIKLISRSKVNNYFNFIGSKPPSEIAKYLSISDVALISLSNQKVFERTLPSKLQSYLACGIPILASANGELSQIILESKAGISSSAGNQFELADSILLFMSFKIEDLRIFGSNGLKYSNEFFNKNLLLDRLDDLFKKKNGKFKNV